MAMNDCRECGGRVADSAPVCPHCGARLPTDTAARLATERRGIALGIALAVLVVLLIVGFVIYAET